MTMTQSRSENGVCYASVRTCFTAVQGCDVTRSRWSKDRGEREFQGGWGLESFRGLDRVGTDAERKPRFLANEVRWTTDGAAEAIVALHSSVQQNLPNGGGKDPEMKDTALFNSISSSD